MGRVGPLAPRGIVLLIKRFSVAGLETTSSGFRLISVVWARGSRIKICDITAILAHLPNHGDGREGLGFR